MNSVKSNFTGIEFNNTGTTYELNSGETETVSLLILTFKTGIEEYCSVPGSSLLKIML